MTWFYLAVGAQLLFAVVFVIDAFLIKNAIRNPQVMTFLIGILNMGGFLLLFFFPSVPTMPNLVMDLAVGALTAGALYGFFVLMLNYEATRTVPIVGAAVGIWSVVFDILFRGEAFTIGQFIAIALLVIGGFLLAYDPKAKKISWKLSAAAIGIGAIYALQFVWSKMTYDNQGFWEAFIWMRPGMLLPVVFWACFGKFRKNLKKVLKEFTARSAGLFLGDQALGAMAYLMQSWAIDLENASLVNALQGTQYLFLFVLVAIVQRKTHALKESLDRMTVLLKVFAILLIILGIVVLFLPLQALLGKL